MKFIEVLKIDNFKGQLNFESALFSPPFVESYLFFR